MTPHRARALGRQRYPSGPRTRRIHAAVPATSGLPQKAPGGRAYQTHRTHGRKISCIRLYLSLGAVRGRAAPRCDPLRLSPRLGRICVSDTFVFILSLCVHNTQNHHFPKYYLPLDSATLACLALAKGCGEGCRTGGFFLCLQIKVDTLKIFAFFLPRPTTLEPSSSVRHHSA